MPNMPAKEVRLQAVRAGIEEVHIDPEVKLWLVPPYNKICYGRKHMWYLLDAYGKRLWLSPSYGTLAAISITSPGRKWLTKELVELIWENPDNEPEFPEITISLIILRLKKRLARYGLDFITSSGRGEQGRMFFGIRPLDDYSRNQVRVKSDERTERHLEPA